MNILSLSGNPNEAGTRIRRSDERVAQGVAVLSSGSRLQQAKDDVASLSISTRLSTRVTAMRSIVKGMAEAVSLLQVADDGLKNIQEMLHRMKALTVMAGNGTLAEKDRRYLDLEFQGLKAEIDHIANSTNFNDVYLLNRKSIPFTPLYNSGNSFTGDFTNETQEGTDDSELFDPHAGNDTVLAGGGDDLIDSTGFASGLQGAVYDTGGGIGNLAAAEAIVTAAAGTPTATFTATSLDYPNGAPNVAVSTIGNFLGVDGATISNPAILPVAATTVVFTYEGYIRVDAAGTYSFSVGSDDGFDLQIDGATVTQFPNNRGFGTTTGPATLGAGYHSFRLLYWENGGQEGLLATSSLNGGILGQDVLAFGAGEVDGNDLYDGGEGYDIVTFDGNKSDYTITDLGGGEFQITDNRPFSPNGTDRLVNVEVARFADSDVELIPNVSKTTFTRPLISYLVSESGSQTLDFDLLPVTLDELFDEPDSLNLLSRTDAETAQDAVEAAIDIVTSRRAYVGSKQVQSDIVAAVTGINLQSEDNSRAVLADADIPVASTEYAQSVVQKDMAISVAAQTNRLRSDALLRIVQDGNDATRELVTGAGV